MNVSSHSIKTVYLLRHGELTDSGILCGHTDLSLSEKGWQQLNDATHSLPNITQCYSSSLVRCSSFAKHYAKQHNISLSVDERLKEMNFGIWDGLPYQTLWDAPQASHTPSTFATSTAENKKSHSSAHISHFWDNPWESPPPNGETMVDFSARVENVWADICASAFSAEAASQGDVLIVSHGGVIKHLLARILQIPLSSSTHLNTLDVKYAALIKISLFNDGDKIWPQVIFE